jgi:hypothetical protein
MNDAGALPLFDRGPQLIECETCPTRTPAPRSALGPMPMGWITFGRSSKPGQQLAVYCPVCAQQRWPTPGLTSPF